MNKTPIIGVTPRYITEEGTKKQFVNCNYIESLNKYNMNSIMLTIDNPDYESILNLCDGFLVTGGIDVNPVHFNEEMNGTHTIDDSLDAIDKVVVDWAVKNKKPLLGICRGHQTINVFMGGNLIQDIGQDHNKVTHTVSTIKNRLLNFDSSINVNSYHHQVVKTLANGLIEVANSNEGYNEAFIHESLPIIGVQWHPERMMDEESSKIIFSTFKDLVLNNMK